MSVYVVAQGRVENRKMLDEYVGHAIGQAEAKATEHSDFPAARADFDLCPVDAGIQCGRGQ